MILNFSVEDKELNIKFHGKIIDQMGFQTYQSATASIAELIANAWDADAMKVEITLPNLDDETPEIIIKDDGIGMTIKECQEKYLNIGYPRRGKKVEEFSKEKKRRILGRKGIGKFAGFGIANIIKVETISKSTGEKTIFEMDRDELITDEYIVQGGKLDAKYEKPNDDLKDEHGTSIILKKLNMRRMISKQLFPKNMARRFLLHQKVQNFKIIIDEKPLPEDEGLEKIQFVFPRDYKDDEKYSELSVDNGWGVEKLSNGEEVRWKISFYTETIKNEADLNGVAIFSAGKLSQTPFLFNITGGVGGQAGIPYIAGQVEADFVDRLKVDPMSAERQRINWAIPETQPLQKWGKNKVKELLLIWHDRRGEARRIELETKVAGFSDRLEKLPPVERKTIRRVLEKLGSIPALTIEEYTSMGEAILTSWEGGRLKDVIMTLSDSSELPEEVLLKIFVDTQVISALNIAEAIKTKLILLSQLKERIKNKDLETAIRDYIAKNPWIISEKWETFQIEKSMNAVIKQIAKDAGFLKEEYKGRMDLVLSSGNQLLVIEFMRPGLTINFDHTGRFRKYVQTIRTQVRSQSGGQFVSVTGLIVADNMDKSAPMLEEIQSLANDNMFARDWRGLLGDAISSYRQYLEILVNRGEGDERLKSLLND